MYTQEQAQTDTVNRLLESHKDVIEKILDIIEENANNGIYHVVFTGDEKFSYDYIPDLNSKIDDLAYILRYLGYQVDYTYHDVYTGNSMFFPTIKFDDLHILW